MKSSRIFSRREFLKKSLKGIILSNALIFSCGDDHDEPKNPIGPNPPPPQNNAPNTEIFVNFQDDGKVNYTFKGTDSDGNISYITVKLNEGDSQYLNNNSSKLVEIIKGNNTVKATAYDDKGLADLNPAEYSFNSPDEDEAKKTIDNIFVGTRAYWNSIKSNALLSLGEKDSFVVDYLVKRNDGKDAVVNYIGYKKDLNQEISNQKILSSFRIPSLYLVRIPANEINSKLSSFISNGFN